MVKKKKKALKSLDVTVRKNNITNALYKVDAFKNLSECNHMLGSVTITNINVNFISVNLWSDLSFRSTRVMVDQQNLTKVPLRQIIYQ